MAGRIPGMSGPLAGRCWPAGRSLETPGQGSRLTDGGKIVSPTHGPHSTPQKHYFLLLILISATG
jgi:hypothetical protein